MKQPDPIAFTLFGVDIRWYGILIGTGFILAIILSYMKAKKHNISPEFILDFAIFLIPFSILGARLYYVFFSWDYYKFHPSEILNIRGGGMAIHGGIIAGLIVALILCKVKKVNPFNLADLVFPQVALAQAIGRWGNFCNGEAHGGPTDLPWAILVDGQHVHPTFLYESLWCFFLFILLNWMDDNKKKFTGQIGLLYGMLYSVERFFVEGLRTDSLMIGPLRQAQVLSVVVFVICLIVYIYLDRQNKKTI